MNFVSLRVNWSCSQIQHRANTTHIPFIYIHKNVLFRFKLHTKCDCWMTNIQVIHKVYRQLPFSILLHELVGFLSFTSGVTGLCLDKLGPNTENVPLDYSTEKERNTVVDQWVKVFLRYNSFQCFSPAYLQVVVAYVIMSRQVIVHTLPKALQTGSIRVGAGLRA